MQTQCCRTLLEHVFFLAFFHLVAICAARQFLLFQNMENKIFNLRAANIPNYWYNYFNFQLCLLI